MKQKAFTLIELLVVIAVIGLISSIVLVSLRGTRSKAQVAKSLSFSQSIYHALGAYARSIYRFEIITASKTTDASGYGNNLTCTGNCSLSEGMIGEAVSLDGSSFFEGSDIKSFSFSETDEITIEAWFKLTGHSDTDAIVSVNVMDPPLVYCVYGIGVDQNLNPVYNPGDSGFACSNNHTIADFTFELNRWYHYVMTVKGGGEAEIYVNGRSISKSSNGVLVDLPDANHIMIGFDAMGGFLEGVIDEVRVYGQSFNL